MYIIYNDSGIKLGINTHHSNDVIVNMTSGDKVIEADIEDISRYQIINDTLVEKPLILNPYQKKKQRQTVINEIVVTTSSGKVFNGSEESQSRMLLKYNIALMAGDKKIKWKLKDNTKVDIDLEELKEALILSNNILSDIIMEA
ncbi:hypothetical protein [Sulfuricurvum sp.]|uniref:DUF4376 domain-containing protein n=1 Tax=Sulfuricurvum sp. TaxID=2025608 RepID=UPI0026170BA5|nr:hypothetical protein [Sulfuricurvum sp.]MDD2267456.1 hypothetical protein [Sulfuricurvum sp.]MDD2782822.1 hypothetical protein [Sulfuricurvum sp.]